MQIAFYLEPTGKAILKIEDLFGIDPEPFAEGGQMHFLAVPVSGTPALISGLPGNLIAGPGQPLYRGELAGPELMQQLAIRQAEGHEAVGGVLGGGYSRFPGWSFHCREIDSEKQLFRGVYGKEIAGKEATHQNGATKREVLTPESVKD
jgi:hypothetical protein